ncbi:MAG TPA: DinB family protein [Candidatus Angelobacter sp.]|nr:DinB family protein [Candidatus Angelobacter sp.]
MPDQIRQTLGLVDSFEQTWKAREKLVEAAEKLAPEEWAHEFDFSWRSMQLLFAHIIEVERSWMLEDIGRNKYPAEDQAAIKTRYATPAAARAQGREVAAITRVVLAEYSTPAKLHETRPVGSGSTQLTVEEILTHVFTHELRHQGQLQVVFRLLGKKPPNLDWF